MNQPKIEEIPDPRLNLLIEIGGELSRKCDDDTIPFETLQKIIDSSVEILNQNDADLPEPILTITKVKDIRDMLFDIIGNNNFDKFLHNLVVMREMKNSNDLAQHKQVSGVIDSMVNIASMCVNNSENYQEILIAGVYPLVWLSLQNVQKPVGNHMRYV